MRTLGAQEMYAGRHRHTDLYNYIFVIQIHGDRDEEADKSGNHQAL